MARLTRDERAIQERLDEIETLIKVVNNDYELYFLGIQSKPPAKRARQLKRLVEAIRREDPRNTGQRFLKQTIVARYNTLSLRWLRTQKQIEDGTYRRLKARLKRQAQRDAATRRRLNSIRSGIKDALAGDESKKDGAAQKETAEAATAQAAPAPAPEPAPAPRPSAPRAGGERPRRKPESHRSDSPALWQAYNKARSTTGEGRLRDPSVLQRRLAAHEKAIRARYGAREVRFKVTVEDGKTRLKAIPVK